MEIEGEPVVLTFIIVSDRFVCAGFLGVRRPDAELQICSPERRIIVA